MRQPDADQRQHQHHAPADNQRCRDGDAAQNGDLKINWRALNIDIHLRTVSFQIRIYIGRFGGVLRGFVRLVEPERAHRVDDELRHEKRDNRRDGMEARSDNTDNHAREAEEHAQAVGLADVL